LVNALIPEFYWGHSNFDNNKEDLQDLLMFSRNHEVFQSLADAFEKDKEKLALYTQLLYNQALLIEGLPIEDPSPFQTICAKS
jgi:molecular chaperone HtpG